MERTPFDDLLARLGREHEKKHLATLPDVLDLSGLGQEERELETLRAIRSRAPAIYQGRFRCLLEIGGEACELVGEPDFLICATAQDGFFIRDSKLARRVEEGHHEEIRLQLQIYGWLYEQAVGASPLGLQVHAGTEELIAVPYDGGRAALDFLKELRGMRLAPEDVYEPVGWSKCGGCGYFERCWKRAEEANDISLLLAVDQRRARELRARGIATIRDVAGAIEDPALRDLFYEGKKKPKLRAPAVRLLRSAEAHTAGKHIMIAPPALPKASNFAMLDFEGLPPYSDELEKVYLWGAKVYGERPSRHLPAESGFGPDGDREGWVSFLRVCAGILQAYGEIPFVHWSPYERTKIETYIKRHGDPDGIASRVLGRLVDLLGVLRASIVLPLPSNSLKVIERYVGFSRRLSEGDGTWAIARYIEATETSNPTARAKIMGQILVYNEEDLDATWVVMEWMGCQRPARVESNL